MRSDFPAFTRAHFCVYLCCVAVFLIFSLAIASSARAETNPADFVRTLAQEATEVVADEGLSRSERRTAMARMLEDYFDLDLIGRVVLGQHWRKASTEEQRDYRDVFKAYLLATYGRRFETYAGETLTVGRVVDDGADGVSVSSRLNRPQAAAITVAWRLRRDGETWRVVDLIVEGVSMVMTHRSEFDAVVRQGGGRIAALLDKLRAMVARLDAPDALQASQQG